MDYTHEIIRIERSVTKNSRSPMWRCQTSDGQMAFVFQHHDLTKDNTHLFREAGYFDLMEPLQVGEALEWTGAPIRVHMDKDGQWWRLTAVEPRMNGAEPDVLWKPDLDAYVKRAHRQSLTIINSACRFLDVETTGLRMDDEIVSIAVIDQAGAVLLDTLVKPRHPEKLLRPGKNGMTASEVNGLTPEQLENAPSFYDIWPQLHLALDCSRWVVYNAGFDVGMIDRHCSDYQCPLLITAGVYDAARLAAEYLGNWNEKRQWFENLPLADALIELGGSATETHQARADAELTLEILQAIARGVPVATNEHPF